MKEILDWQSKEIVDIYDEVNLWSAPFGKLLGFGTGFPLVELSQRFGPSSKIFGVDIWEEAINRTKRKIELLEIRNIEILQKSASEIKIQNETIDLVTSNLGVNNFEERDKVYSEIHRILKKDGILSITTNPAGTFEQLFEQFQLVLEELKLEDGMSKLKTYIDRRKNEDQIIQEVESHNLRNVKYKTLLEKLDEIISEEGEFRIDIPMLYLEFKK